MTGRHKRLTRWSGWAIAVLLVAGCDGRKNLQGRYDEPAANTAPAQFVASVTATQKPIDAPSLFAMHCGACHGPSGRGDGAAAYLLYPKPRDLTGGIFRFKSTPGDSAPTRDDLRRVIGEGIERTAMPSFKAVLTTEQLDAMVDYVLELNTGDKEASAPPVTIPAKPPFSEQLALEGKLLYDAAGCAMCHGATGRGDGPSSATLVDSNGMPLPAADFTADVFKAGRTAEDLYRTLAIGVPGTPMPSYTQSLEQLSVAGVDANTDKIWALVAYLRSIAVERERVGERSAAAIHVRLGHNSALLTDPWHADWQGITPTPISVQPLWQRAHAPRTVEVRAVQCADSLAILLEWPDATRDDASDSVHQFSDAAALMFPLDVAAPVLTMGLGTDSAVQAMMNIWQWKASWQSDADAGAIRDLRDEGRHAHVGVPADLYMLKQGDRTAGPIAEHDTTFLPAWAVGNPRANPQAIGRVVLESNAAGFGTLTVQPQSQQHVTGRGEWRDGRWRIVMTRTFAASDGDDVTFTARHPVAIAVWDGSAGDRNGTKLISGWHWLMLQGR